MKALLIIDVQKDFLPGGALAVPDADRVVPLINELMPAYELVVATQDWHPEDHGSFAANHEGKSIGELAELDGLEQILWPVHCVQGSPGAEFSEALHAHRIDHVVRKGGDPRVDSYSGFHDNGRRRSTGLADLLRREGVTEVHLVGVATDYCVKFTALDAIDEGFRTVLIQDACEGVNLQVGDVGRAVDAMRQAGAEVLRSDAILGEEVTLYRPVGPEELTKLETVEFRAWPARLPEQPIFYPVTNEGYAEQIAREWNVPDSGSAAVTRFQVKRSFLQAYQRKVVGGLEREEYWIPAEDLDAMNEALVGPIEVIQTWQPTTPC